MGAWGTGIFQDDLACDVRDRYKDLLGEGLSGYDLNARILDEFRGSVQDPDENGVLWLALAAVQWKHGRLDSDTLSQALRIIESGSDLTRWDVSQTDRTKRRVALEKLRQKITSAQPRERPVAQRVLCVSPWRTGDLFAYRLVSGGLIIFRVIGDHSDNGGKYPVCEILNWVGKEIPSKDVLKKMDTMRSRADYKHKIFKVMLVGLNKKWLKRIESLDINTRPFHKRVLSFIPETTVSFERVPTSIVHFKILDSFLKEWFLVE